MTGGTWNAATMPHRFASDVIRDELAHVTASPWIRSEAAGLVHDVLARVALAAARDLARIEELERAVATHDDASRAIARELGRGEPVPVAMLVDLVRTMRGELRAHKAVAESAREDARTARAELAAEREKSAALEVEEGRSRSRCSTV